MQTYLYVAHFSPLPYSIPRSPIRPSSQALYDLTHKVCRQIIPRRSLQYDISDMTGAPQTMVVLCIVTLVVASLCPGSAAGSSHIGYGAIRRGIPTCGGGSQRPCLPPPSNGYHHGCEKSQGCRGPHDDEAEAEPEA